MKGRMWHVIKNMYEASRSAILLEGEKSAAFRVEQGVAHGFSLCPIIFLVFINSLLKDVEVGLRIEITSGKRMGVMSFADDLYVLVSRGNGAWNVHIKKVINNGRKKVNQLHSIISNQDINLSACKEYGREIWEGNKGQVAPLQSIILGGS